MKQRFLLKMVFFGLTLACGAEMDDQRNEKNGGYGSGATDIGDNALFANTTKKEVKCQSRNYKKNKCKVSGKIESIKSKKQLSKTKCKNKENYGKKDNYVWVDDGCRGNFEVKYKDGNKDKDKDKSKDDDKNKRTCMTKQGNKIRIYKHGQTVVPKDLFGGFKWVCRDGKVKREQ